MGRTGPRSGFLGAVEPGRSEAATPDRVPSNHCRLPMGNRNPEEGNMSDLQHLGPWRGTTPRAVVVLGGLLALAASPTARAVTSFSVDGRSQPITFFQGETVTLRMDVGKAGGAVNFRFARDPNRSGK